MKLRNFKEAWLRYLLTKRSGSMPLGGSPAQGIIPSSVASIDLYFGRTTTEKISNANAWLIQPSLPNTRAELALAPSGTASISYLTLWGSSDTTGNAFSIISSSTQVQFQPQSANTNNVNVIHYGGSGSAPTEAFRITNDATPVFKTATGLGINSASTNNQIWSASQGAGTTTLYIGNASINVTSDVRLKEILGPSLLNATELLKQLVVKRFKWADPSDTSENNKNSRGIWEFGGVAQDWIKTVPWLVNAPKRDCEKCLAGKKCDDHLGVWQIDYAYMTPMLVKSLQEQDERIAKLEAQIAELKASK